VHHDLTEVRVLDNATQLDGRCAAGVVVTSHGGGYASYLAAAAGARGVVSHVNNAAEHFEMAFGMIWSPETR
jgi:hypothetical protein